MDFFFVIYLFIFGSILGSFLNVCIYRIPKDISIISPPSNCPLCKKKILAKDNIPILSYIFLKGRCRFCSERISVRYPVVELISAIALPLFFILFGFNFLFFKTSILFYILFTLSMIDIETGELSIKITVFGAVIGIIFLFLNNELSLISGLLGAGLGFVLVFFTYFVGKILLKKNAIGGGDLYLMMMLGLYLGWKKIITAYFLSFIIAGIFFLLLMVKLKRVPWGEPVPFVPFISAGAILGLTIGSEINNFYLSNFVM